MARRANFDRAEILEKAMRLFWTRGYQGTSLKHLEDALDMRPGSIYAAFGSKEQLYDEALKRYAEKSRKAFAETMAWAQTPLTGLAAHVRSFGRAAADDAPARACMLVKTLLETPNDDPVLRRSTEDMMRATEASFADAFRAAQDNGEIEPDADVARLASRLQSEIFGLRAYAQRTDAKCRIADLAEDIARGIEGLSVRA